MCGIIGCDAITVRGDKLLLGVNEQFIAIASAVG